MKDKRNCRKCGERIPYWIKIDGVNRNLGSRKFCLKCSPYKGHNTKVDDPQRPPKKYNDNPYTNWSEDKKLLHRARVCARGLDRKLELIRLSGGKCKKCGYDKCDRALSFHHRNPKEKKFCLSLNVLWSTPWETILEEFKKCDLLCLNCHSEVENLKSKITSVNYKDIIDRLYPPENRVKPATICSKNCPICKNIFITKDKERIYCSVKCSDLSRRKVERPSKEQLKEMLQTTSMVQIGKKYGVCDKAVRKWAKSYCLIN